MNNFWSAWIIILTVTSLIICYGLVWWSVKHPLPVDENQRPDNPIPSWWLYLFYLNIIFIVAYLSLYPALGAFPGTWQWSAQRQYAEERMLYQAQYAEQFKQYLALPVTEVARNPVARQIGRRLFLTYCANCHQPGGKEDALHYPVLADQDWLWGGEPEQIKTTIVNGRTGMMPAWGTVFDANGIATITNYVMTLAGRQPLNSNAVIAGQEKFARYCYFCHGRDGQGDIRIGGPNLTDAIWLHIAPQDATTDIGLAMGIKTAINDGFINHMPAHWKMLDPARIHVLTGYILSLSLSP